MSDLKVLVVCADGSEDIELASITDTLRRAKLNVTLATVNATLRTTLARGLKLEADALLDDVAKDASEFAAIVLPGGLPGATHLAASATLKRLLEAQNAAGRLVAAVCASPVVVLHAHGLIGERKAVAYPGFVAQLSNAQASERVVVDGNLITSAGPGTSIEFALAIVEKLVDKATAQTLAEQMLVKL